MASTKDIQWINFYNQLRARVAVEFSRLFPEADKDWTWVLTRAEWALNKADEHLDFLLFIVAKAPEGRTNPCYYSPVRIYETDKKPVEGACGALMLSVGQNFEREGYAA
jgi:hypothetical protein